MKIQKKTLISIGNRLLKIYRYRSAYTCFEKAGSKHLIIEHGNMCLLEGNAETALKAYGFSGEIIPNELMIKCGDYHARRSPSLHANEAIDAYHYAKANEKLVNFAKKMLKKGELEYAKRAYRIAGKELSKEELLGVANMWLEDGYEEKALNLYSELKSFPNSNILIRSGTKRLKAGYLQAGLLLFKKAKSTPSKQLIIACGDKSFTRGNLEEGLKAYKIVKKKPSKKLLIICAKSALRKNDHYYDFKLRDAIEACLMAGMKKPILILGKKYFTEGKVEFGEMCFKAMKINIPVDLLISCGDNFAKNLGNNHRNNAASMYGEVIKRIITKNAEISKVITSEMYHQNIGFAG